MSIRKYQAFLKGIEPYMQLDEYGLSTICNIYYDTDTSELIRTSIEKPVYKEKVRLRSYGVPKDDSKVYLEIKKKFEGVVYKRRESMTLSECRAYLETGMAYYGKEDKELRMTFDTKIRSRDYELDLSMGDHGELLLPEGQYLLEIKIPMAMPMWLAKLLSELEIYPVSFSKYGAIYMKSIDNKVI